MISADVVSGYWSLLAWWHICYDL